MCWCFIDYHISLFIYCRVLLLLLLYFPIVTRSFKMFTDSKENEKYQVLRKILQVYSAVIWVLQDRHTYRHDETEICCFEYYHTDSATGYCSSCKLFQGRLIAPRCLPFPEAVRLARLLARPWTAVMCLSARATLSYDINKFEIEWVLLEQLIFWYSC